MQVKTLRMRKFSVDKIILRQDDGVGGKVVKISTALVFRHLISFMAN